MVPKWHRIQDIAGRSNRPQRFQTTMFAPQEAILVAPRHMPCCPWMTCSRVPASLSMRMSQAPASTAACTASRYSDL